MVADVPVGVFLSGGYDSSIVTAILQKNRTDKLKTFTIGFYEEKYNEANYAKEVANYLGTDHTEYYCTQQEALNIVPTLAKIYDEPFADQSAIPTILVSKLARQYVTVSLSADGGDEIFGGYNKYLTNLEMKSKIFKLLKIFRKNNLDRIAYLLQEKGIIKDKFLINKIAKLIYEDSIELQKLVPYFTTPVQIQKLIGDYKKLDTNFDKVIEVNDTAFNKMFAIDYKTYMVDDVLHKVDRATMSVSLEGREPLLDYRIIEFVAQLPDKYKIKDGEKKWLLKQITHKYIPKEIMDRPKMGFGVPIEEWLKNELRYLIENFFEIDSILDKKELIKIKNLFFQSRVNYQMVWNILIFQMWWKRWM
jgi:asparagine synthase (glutamine-hydrolysing)